jgi:transcriptional regulator with XRE-family HTH domain
MQRYLIVRGPTAKAVLSQQAEKSPRMIERYMSGAASPSQHTAYKLALACGLNEEDALALARECSSEAKDTA